MKEKLSYFMIIMGVIYDNGNKGNIIEDKKIREITEYCNNIKRYIKRERKYQRKRKARLGEGK